MAVQSKALSLEFGVREIADAVASGELTPTDVAESVLARIDETEEKIHAFSQYDAADVRAQAATLTEEAAAGRLRGPLHGVPVSIKEWFNVKGFRNLMRGADTYVDTDDATVVARLRDAGAIIVGKTHTPLNGSPPPTRNPWALEHTAGGTSSGCGASVGARVVPISIGEQTAGSNLRPAAYCGVSGIKPSYGRLSRAGMYASGYSRDHPGLIGLNMEDMALVMSALSGYDPGDQSTKQYAPLPADLKMAEYVPPSIGVVRNFFPEKTQPVMQEAIEKSAATMASAGATVKDVMLPADYDLAWTAISAIGAEAATRRAGEAPVNDARAASRRAAELLPATYYIQARRIRTWLNQEIKALMQSQGLDALLMACAPGAAPLGLQSTGEATLLQCWSFLGVPAITVNGGMSPEGLPLGLQMVAPLGEDYELMRVGAWSESTLGQLPTPSF
jgi:aspartyl-tRNA(Asn)/glutamyl-tRNA(Gln) amidotransferase subunit A